MIRYRQPWLMSSSRDSLRSIQLALSTFAPDFYWYPAHLMVRADSSDDSCFFFHGEDSTETRVRPTTSRCPCRVYFKIPIPVIGLACKIQRAVADKFSVRRTCAHGQCSILPYFTLSSTLIKTVEEFQLDSMGILPKGIVFSYEVDNCGLSDIYPLGKLQ